MTGDQGPSTHDRPGGGSGPADGRRRLVQAVTLAVTLTVLASVASVAALSTAPSATAAPTGDGEPFTVATDRLLLDSQGTICAERESDSTNLVAIRDATLRNFTIYDGDRHYRMRAGDPDATLNGTLILRTTGENEAMDALAAAGACVPLDQRRPVVLEAHSLGFAEIDASEFVLTTGRGSASGAPAPGGLRLGDALAPEDGRDGGPVSAWPVGPDVAPGPDETVTRPVRSLVENGTVAADLANGTVDNATAANATRPNDTVGDVVPGNATDLNGTVPGAVLENATGSNETLPGSVSGNATDRAGESLDGVLGNATVENGTAADPDGSDGPVAAAADAVGDAVDRTADAIGVAAGLGGGSASGGDSNGSTPAGTPVPNATETPPAPAPTPTASPTPDGLVGAVVESAAGAVGVRP